MELLERLIEEAQQHGFVKHQRDDALAALERMGRAIETAKDETSLVATVLDKREAENGTLRAEVHESRNREQALIVMLTDVGTAAQNAALFLDGIKKKPAEKKTWSTLSADLEFAIERAKAANAFIPF